MQRLWSGRYLDGVSAGTVDVEIGIGREALRIAAPAGVMIWRYADITQTQGRYAGEPVRLERGTQVPVDAIIVDDIAFLAAIHATAPQAARRLHNPARRRGRPLWVAAAAVGGILAGAALYLWGIPAAAEAMAERVPVEWEEKLGDTVVESLVGDLKVCEGGAVRPVIDDLVARLDRAAPAHPYDFRVTLVDDPTVNALAAPGGGIVVFSGLLQDTTRPEQLAGVLAHEMQHVLQRHGTKSLFRRMSNRLLLSLLVGDLGGATATVLETAESLHGLSYSRAAETEADVRGMHMMQGARLDARGMVEFFGVLEKHDGPDPGPLGYLSTHPATRDRIARLQGLADQSGYRPVDLGITPKAWKAMVAAACGPHD
ncbi:MAG TPA: M48 family metallopeptidase [Acidiferrobacterales bacterium]